MKERPILFSGPMVRAILEGRKTQTRRIVKPDEWFEGHRTHSCLGAVRKGEISRYEDLISSRDGGIQRRCPYGSPGDRLWVRETWALMPTQHDWERWVVYQADRMAHRSGMAEDENVHYRPIDRLDEWTPRIWTGDDPKWRRSFHMPRWASRITLEVTGVRVERLQDISEKDAKAEGIEAMPDGLWRNYMPHGPLIEWQSWESPRDSFQSLWQSINGPCSWEVNPWVWVVEFKHVQKGGEV